MSKELVKSSFLECIRACHKNCNEHLSPPQKKNILFNYHKCPRKSMISRIEIGRIKTLENYSSFNNTYVYAVRVCQHGLQTKKS